MKNIFPKIIVLALIASIFILSKVFALDQYLSLTYLKQNHEIFLNYYQHNQIQALGIYFLVYTVTTALSIPGATVLTLLAGALFGNLIGTIVVSFASTAGASLAFILARFFLRDYIQTKFQISLQSINQGIEKEGALYLFSLRLIPIFPFFVINLVMGLTPLRFWTFYLVSQVGMLPGTIVYVNAGKQLSHLQSLSGILSPALLLSFALLGILPLLSKKLMEKIKAHKVYSKFQRPKKYDYNMVVIGAGSAGLVTSYISAAVKAKVALIEKHKMGGDCLNTGCVPSKALLRSAKMLHYARHADRYGLKSYTPDFDFATIMQRVQKVIKEIEPHDSTQRYGQLGVECIQGAARIISPWEVEVGGKILTTKNITIATGASPFIPAILGVDKVAPLTSDNLWNLRELPKRFLVLGGGPIGCEMAQAFSRLGSQVTQVEMLTRIMAIEDEDISQIITERFKQEGISVLTSHKARQFGIQNGEKFLICEFQGKDVQIFFDEVLIAVGRKANITGFGLEDLGISMRSNRTIEANEFLQTNYPNIFVCGDVTGPFQLTHTASHQAWYCAVNGLFGKFKKFKVDYSVIPWCTYTDPEIASVGLNEQMANKKGIAYEVTTYGIDDLDRAIADSENHGIIKVLTAKGSDKILGATIVGNHASDLLLEFITAMKYRLGLNKILATIHIYPTMGEANKYLAGNWKKAHVSPRLLGFLQKFHRFQRGN